MNKHDSTRSDPALSERFRIGVKPGQWGWTFDELQASWVAAEEGGFDIVSCFDHVTSAPAGLAAWDAPTLLAAMAAVTSRVTLTVDVVNAALRHPVLLAGQLAVAQAASAGRVQVGLGAGSYHLARQDHRVLGLAFPSFQARVERLAMCCELLPALWRGATVSRPELGISQASLGPIGIVPPPVFVGGTSDAVMELAARHADGWNAGVPDPDRWQALSRRMQEICGRVGRSRPLQQSVQVFVRDVGERGIADMLRRLRDAGAGAVTFVLTDERGPDAVRRLVELIRR